MLRDASRILIRLTPDSMNLASTYVDCQRCFNPQTYESVMIYPKGRIKAVDGIKAANQFTLRWGDDTGLSQWAQC